ncbi:MAG: transporter substrate-binding domain-containing protein [Cyanobacteria bacterium J06626_6]
MKRRWFLAGLTMSLAGAGCRSANAPYSGDPSSGKGDGPEASEGPLANVVRNSKTLVMATAPNYPPYQQVVDTPALATSEEAAEGDSQGPNIIGFDIDLAGMIAERLGRQLTIVDLEFGALIPALVNDEVDMVMAAMEPNRSRKQRVDFSNIYYRSQHALISLDGYLRSRDLSYQTIGIRADSVQARYAKNLTESVPGLDIVPYATLGGVFEALDIGAIEGAIVEATVASTYLRRYPDFKGNIIPSEKATGSAIALPKNSPLRKDINAALTDIKASGEMDQLINQWFS